MSATPPKRTIVVDYENVVLREGVPRQNRNLGFDIKGSYNQLNPVWQQFPYIRYPNGI
jgi:hypothetical protein